MSTKKNDGALSGSAASNCRRRLPSICTTRHQQREAEPERQHDGRRQRAGPVDVGDREPQQRVSAARRVGARPHISAVATRRSTTKVAAAAATKIDGDPAVVGEQDRERRRASA